MMFILGFILCAVCILVGVPLMTRKLYHQTTLIPNAALQKKQPNTEPILITYAYVIPYIALVLAALLFVAIKLTKSIVEQGLGDFIFFGLVFPVLGFLLGYMYLKKVIKG